MKSASIITEPSLLDAIGKLWMASQLVSVNLKKELEKKIAQEKDAQNLIEQIKKPLLQYIEIVNLYLYLKELAETKRVSPSVLPLPSCPCSKEFLLELNKQLDTYSAHFSETIRNINESCSSPEYTGSPSWEIVKEYSNDELTLWSKQNTEYLENIKKEADLREKNIGQFLSDIKSLSIEITKLSTPLQETANKLVLFNTKLQEILAQQKNPAPAVETKEEKKEQASVKTPLLPKGTMFNPFQEKTPPITEPATKKTNHRCCII